jgi:hypothetical protein
MNTAGAAVITFSVQVITVPVSDVGGSMSTGLASRSMSIMRRTTPSASCSSHRWAPAARSRSARA